MDISKTENNQMASCSEALSKTVPSAKHPSSLQAVVPKTQLMSTPIHLDKAPVGSLVRRNSSFSNDPFFPPCGDSFFEENLDLPSSLATFREQNSPAALQSTPTASSVKKFSFKKPGTTVSSSASTPPVSRPSLGLTPGSFSTPGTPDTMMTLPHLKSSTEHGIMTPSNSITSDQGLEHRVDPVNVTNVSSFGDQDTYSWDDIPYPQDCQILSPGSLNKNNVSLAVNKRNTQNRTGKMWSSDSYVLLVVYLACKGHYLLIKTH